MTKVLLIEDDSETAEEITAELTDRGFEVEWSTNGVEGLESARSSRPDAMIVDRLLPGMDGLTVIETLRKDQVRTPVLVLSALRRGWMTACVDYGWEATTISPNRLRWWSLSPESRRCYAGQPNRAKRHCM
jgi:CheY-like chemotaxis protein